MPEIMTILFAISWFWNLCFLICRYYIILWFKWKYKKLFQYAEVDCWYSCGDGNDSVFAKAGSCRPTWSPLCLVGWTDYRFFNVHSNWESCLTYSKTESFCHFCGWFVFLLVTFSCFCYPFYHMPHSTCRFLLIWRLDLFHLLRVEHILVCTFLLRHLGSFDLSEICHVQKETRILSSLGHLSRWNFDYFTFLVGSVIMIIILKIINFWITERHLWR